MSDTEECECDGVAHRTTLQDRMFIKVTKEINGELVQMDECVLCKKQLKPKTNRGIGRMTGHFKVCIGDKKNGLTFIKSIPPEETYVWNEKKYFDRTGSQHIRRMQPIIDFFKEAWEKISKENEGQGAEGAEAVGEEQEVNEEVEEEVKKEVLEGCATVDEALTATEQTLILRRRELAEVEERHNRYLQTNETLVRQNLRMQNEREEFDEQRLRFEELQTVQRLNNEAEVSSIQLERTSLQADRASTQVIRSRMEDERLSLEELRVTVKAQLVDLDRVLKLLEAAGNIIAQRGQVPVVTTTAPDSGLHSEADDTAPSTREGSMEPKKL